MEKITNLHKLFLHGLSDVYSAEEQITEALPKLIQKAQGSELKASLQDHLEETKEQIERLDQIFEALGEQKEAMTCKAMKGILEEGEEHVGNADSAMVDLVIAAGCLKVEHYEEATYMALVEMADEMDHDDAKDLLEETLKEEKKAGKILETAAKAQLKEVPSEM
jgi:ferritin-like metal-binding protein YciE